MTLQQEYENKLCKADDAVACVKSGDWVDYGMGSNYPELLDQALAKRKSALKDIKIRGGLSMYPIAVVESDRQRETFTYNSWHFSAYERSLHDKNLCNYIPMTFRYMPRFYDKYLTVNVAFIPVSRMNDRGYFSIGLSNAGIKSILRKANTIVLEENENLPFTLGETNESMIHISEVDMVVRGEHSPIPDAINRKPSDEEIAIASHIVNMMDSGSVLQLGIGGIPDTVGSLIAESDLKNLGCHSEMIGDAYLKIHKAGKLTNECKCINKGKSVWTLAIGTNELYKWLDQNDGAASYPVDYVNAPEIISSNDKVVCINSALQLDLYGQTCAESVGARNISGSGGQLDFLTGAFYSNGGKGFICLTSTYRDANGDLRSRIVPAISDGDIVTDPRSQAFYVVTEFGVINLAGLSTWERAERIISISHPKFRDDLCKSAEQQKIWRKSNR
jgi:acyl-CoA hydrolase